MASESTSTMMPTKKARIELEGEKKEFTREDDEHFMGIALLTAKRSKDPVKKVGACIVNENKQVVGIGYNAFPRGSENHSWTDKKRFVVHAEVNAVVNTVSDNLRNCSLYVTLFPCNECAKIVIQSNITRIIYLEDTDSDGAEEKNKYKASKVMLNNVRDSISCEKYIPDQESLTLHFKVNSSK